MLEWWAQKCPGPLLPRFLSQWEMAAQWRERMSGKNFPPKIKYSPSSDQCIIQFDELQNNTQISIPIRFIHTQISSLSVWNWVWPKTRHEDGACHVGNRSLSLAWKHGTSRVSSRVRASWIQQELAWNSGGISSQSKDGANQKGGEQVATWLRREPGIQDSHISKSAPFPTDPDIRSFVLLLHKDRIWYKAQSQWKIFASNHSLIQSKFTGKNLLKEKYKHSSSHVLHCKYLNLRVILSSWQCDDHVKLLWCIDNSTKYNSKSFKCNHNI